MAAADTSAESSSTDKEEADSAAVDTASDHAAVSNDAAVA